MSAPALSKLVAASFAAAAASSSSTAAASSRAAASSKRSKQVHSSASAHIADDAPFVPHQTHSAFFAAPSACGCGLATGTARILVCGDGDLSYSVGLVRHLVSDSHRERPDGQREGEFTFDNFTSEEDARALRVQAAASQAISDFTETQRQQASDLQLTCTTYEEIETLSVRYAEAHSNAQLLRSWGIKVLHGVDARKLHEYSNLISWSAARDVIRDPDESTVASTAPRDSIQYISTPSDWSFLHRFHHIVFHFPHVGGKSRIHLNRALLTEFLQSASMCLVRESDQRVHHGQLQPVAETRPGCVHVSLIRGQGGTPCDTRQRPNYGDHWQLLECGTKAGLVLTHVFPFVDALYPSYNNRGFRSRNEEFFWRGVAITHVLAFGSVSTKSKGSDSAADIISWECHPQYPLRILGERLTQYFLDRPNTAATNTLATAGFTRAPFAQEVLSPVIDDDLLRHSVWFEEANSVSLNPFPHVTTSPTVPVLSRDGTTLRPDLLVHLDQLLHRTTSSVLSGDVFENCQHLDSLQWNLEPLVSAAADMETELPLPIITQLRQETPSTAVPFMRGGISRVAHSLVLQLFTSAPSAHAEAISSHNLAELLQQDLLEALASYFTAALHFGASFRIVPAPSARTLRLLPRSNETVPRDVEFGFDIHVQHRGMWHNVGRVGIFTLQRQIGWVCELSDEKLAMVRFEVDDPRMLRVVDPRLLEQSLPVSPVPSPFPPLLSFSLHPLAYVRDFSFWLQPKAEEKELPPPSSSASSSLCTGVTLQTLSSEAVYRIFVRLAFELFGDRCCSLTRTDDFVHPHRGPSMRIRCIFHCVIESLSPQCVLQLQEELKQRLVEQTGVEMR